MRSIIQHLFTPPIFEDDEGRSHQARVLNFIVLSTLATLALPLLGAFAATSPSLFAPLAIGVMFVLGLITLGLLRRGYVQQASFLFAGVAWLIIVATSVFFGGVESNAFSYLLLTILVAGLTLGWRAGFGFAILSFVAGLGLLYAQLYNYLPPPLEGGGPINVWANRTALFVMVMVFVFIATRSLNRTLIRAKSSEAELKKYRVHLEELVEARTAELKTTNRQLQQEIAERTEVEDKLQQQRDFAVQVTNALGQGVTVTDHQDRFEYVNPAFAQMLGYAPEELIGKKPADFTLPEDQSILAEANATRRLDETSSYDLRLRRLDNTIIHLFVTGTPRRQEGRVIGSVAITTDLTERQRTAEALRRRDAILEAVAFAAEKFLSTTSWEAHIPEVLDRLGQATTVSRVYIAKNHRAEDGSMLTSQHYEWAAPGINSQINNLELQNFNWKARGYGRWEMLLQKGTPIHSHIRDLPKQEQVLLFEHDIQSILVMPIFVGQTWWGLIGFDDCLTERAWSSTELDALKAAAATLGAAIQREQVEEALRNSEARLRQIIDLVPHFIFAKNREGRFILVNQAIAEAYHTTTQDIVGKSELDIIPSKEDARQYLKDDLEVITNNKPKFIPEETFTDAEGNAHILQTYKIPFTAWDTQEPLVLGVAVDITEQKQAAEALRESEERFRATFEQAAVGIAHLGLDGRWLRVNQKLCNMLGYTREELLNKTFFDITYPENLELNREYINQIIADDIQTYSLEKRYIHKNGSLVWSHVTVSLTRDTSGRPKYLISVIEDITRRKFLEEQLRQSQKLEAIGRLAGGIAHDFNNILTVIIGNSDLLLYTFEENNPLRKDIEQIKRVAERAASLTGQLLAFSRQQTLQPTVLKLNTLIGDTERMLKRLIGEDITLETKLEPELGFVKADPGQMEQVILNLAVNARDVMPTGGRLIIETANVYLTKREVGDQVGIEPGPFVCLAVSDTGPGIDQEIKDHIFEPFFTTKEVGQGTGLGLATVHGIITQSGGFIRVFSELRKGTTFSIYLPQTDVTPPSTTPKTESTAVHQGSETILLVEDEAMVRELARKVLLRKGYVVLEAQNGPEALELAKQYHEPIHLLLTDVLMPSGMSGPQLAKELAASRPKMCVLYMSGYTDNTLAQHGVLESDINFISKPFTANSLINKVRRILTSVSHPPQAE